MPSQSAPVSVRSLNLTRTYFRDESDLNETGVASARSGWDKRGSDRLSKYLVAEPFRLYFMSGRISFCFRSHVHVSRQGESTPTASLRCRVRVVSMDTT